MTTNSEKTKVDNTEKVLEAKWGKSSIAAGFTVLPDVIFHNQKALKLKPLDLVIILHLVSHWWKPNKNPWPAKARLADAIDIDPSTVRRSIQKMEKLGYIKRIYRKAGVGDNLSNEYDLQGLVKAAKALADDKLALKARRAAEDKEKVTTPTTYKLIRGGRKD